MKLKNIIEICVKKWWKLIYALNDFSNTLIKCAKKKIKTFKEYKEIIWNGNEFIEEQQLQNMETKINSNKSIFLGYIYLMINYLRINLWF